MKKNTKECGTFDDACNRAAEFANRHEGGLEMAECFLGRAGWLHATFGTAHVECAGRELAFLNTGDTYSLTLAQEGDGEVFSTSWGDWYENAENKHCEENDAIRCGYCSEFTPVDPEEWSDTICEHCGRNVSNGELPTTQEKQP